MTSTSSKYLDLDVGDQAAAWMIGFAAQAALDHVTDDTELKRHFLASCGVDAISHLRNIMFPAVIDDDGCTYEHIKAVIQRISRPADKSLVAERMSLLMMQQHSDEHPRDFLARINNQAAVCDLATLAENPILEVTKLVFLAGLANPDLKLRLLEHVHAQDKVSVTDLVSLASIVGSQRSFALSDDRPTKAMPVFNSSASCQQQDYTEDCLPIHHSSGFPAAPQWQWQGPGKPCRNCGFQHTAGQCTANNKTCYNCGKRGHFRKVCRSAPKGHIGNVNAEESCLHVWSSFFG